MGLSILKKYNQKLKILMNPIERKEIYRLRRYVR